MQSRLDRIDDWETQAREAGYSPSKTAARVGATLRLLQIFFQERFKVGPHKWMLKVRMTNAAALLASGLSVKDVASRVGYSQASHFPGSSSAYSAYRRRITFSGSFAWPRAKSSGRFAFR